VMMAQPLKACLDAVIAAAPEGLRRRVIYMSPQGKPYTQETAKRLSRDYDHLVLVCGHYEGVDERFIEECVDEEISIGDFVLTGGELAAMVVTDSVCRMVPGVLSDEECYTGESHWDGLLEYPQYTRPEVWEGREVPEVLKGGNHADIQHWRRKQMILRTMKKRPDMFAKLTLSGEDEKLLAEIQRDESRLKLVKPVAYRKARMDDVEDIMLTVRQARNYLKKNRVDQWQGEYPDEERIIKDIENGECYVMTYGEKVAGFFVLSAKPDPNYDELMDGKWRYDEPYCVLHRVAVMAEYRGSGMSQHLLAAVEELTRGCGRGLVRVDTHRKNKAMLSLLRGNGYEFRGNCLVFSEPYHDPRRQAFEKKL